MSELGERISSAEFSEWMAFYQLEPFGEERADMRSAIIASTIANVNRGKNQKPYKVEDFMPHFDEREGEGGDPIAFAAALTMALGGTVNLGEGE